MPDRKWEARIEKIDNGYILWLANMDPEDENGSNNVFVYQEDEDINEKGEEFVSMIWGLAEYFAEIGSKHDAKRFWVGMKGKEG